MAKSKQNEEANSWLRKWAAQERKAAREIKKLGKALDGIPQHIVIQEVMSYLVAELKAEGGQNKSIRKIFLNQLDNLRVKEEFSWQAHGLECFNKFIEVKAKGRHDDEASGTYAFLPFQYEIDEEDEELENDIQEAVNLLGKIYAKMDEDLLFSVSSGDIAGERYL